MDNSVFLCFWFYLFLCELSVSDIRLVLAISLCNWTIIYITEVYFFNFLPFSSVQSLSRVWLFATPWTAGRQASLSITNSQSPPKPRSIESVMPSNHLILCRSLLLLPQSFPALGSFQMSQLFTSGAKVLEFQLQHQSFQWTPRTDLL